MNITSEQRAAAVRHIKLMAAYYGLRVVVDLPVVPVGTSIRLERTADGWADRGVLRSIRLGPLPGPTTVHPPVRLWVDAPSTETNE